MGYIYNTKYASAIDMLQYTWSSIQMSSETKKMWGDDWQNGRLSHPDHQWRFTLIIIIVIIIIIIILIVVIIIIIKIIKIIIIIIIIIISIIIIITIIVIIIIIIYWRLIAQSRWNRNKNYDEHFACFGISGNIAW